MNSNIKLISAILLIFLVSGCAMDEQLNDKLLRLEYFSKYEKEQKNAFVYLPRDYDSKKDYKWPVILFLHGNGERGNAKDELDYVLMHGPLYEAWIQKKNLPFIIISPQLAMLGKEKDSPYLLERKLESIPQRLEVGTPDRDLDFVTDYPMTWNFEDEELDFILPDRGWEEREEDVLLILDKVLKEYNADHKRVYLTGLSYGGYGTWYIGSKNSELFAALAPVVGWGHSDLMQPIADEQIPVWAFAGGRDLVVETKYFFKGLNELERLGHKNVRFTIHADMGHDAWKRIYKGDDLYDWFLEFENKD